MFGLIKSNDGSTKYTIETDISIPVRRYYFDDDKFLGVKIIEGKIITEYLNVTTLQRSYYLINKIISITETLQDKNQVSAIHIYLPNETLEFAIENSLRNPINNAFITFKTEIIASI
jgi:hypothetical protein